MSSIATAEQHLERLSVDIKVDYLGSKVEIGDFFCFRSNNCYRSTEEGVCLGITPTGLWIEYRYDKSMGHKVKEMVPYENIYGRIPKPLGFDRSFGKDLLFALTLIGAIILVSMLI